MSAASATVRVSGPSAVSGSVFPRIGMRPVDGFRPTTPQQAAGTRIEPPPSEPSARGPTPAAAAAAAPPLEPPEVRVGSQGVPVVPVRWLSVTPSIPYSGVVVLPIKMAPACLSRCQLIASSSGTLSFQLLQPYVVRIS